MTEMLPCPFCDKDVAEISNCQELEGCRHFEKCPATEPYVCVVCNMHEGGCGASSGYYDSAANAIGAWNGRSDAVPVVRGEWIEHEDEMECPQCGYFWNYCDNDTERFNYCPNCGAKMDGGTPTMAKYKSITEMAEEIRDEALDNIEYSGITLRELCDKLKSNEYAPVVRCSECKYNTSEKKCLYPDSIIKIPDDNDFCSYGEKMESEVEK